VEQKEMRELLFLICPSAHCKAALNGCSSSTSPERDRTLHITDGNAY